MKFRNIPSSVARSLIVAAVIATVAVVYFVAVAVMGWSILR
jgi:hypothetical protein